MFLGVLIPLPQFLMMQRLIRPEVMLEPTVIPSENPSITQSWNVPRAPLTVDWSPYEVEPPLVLDALTCQSPDLPSDDNANALPDALEQTTENRPEPPFDVHVTAGDVDELLSSILAPNS
jgi:hypothetical protein